MSLYREAALEGRADRWHPTEKPPGLSGWPIAIALLTVAAAGVAMFGVYVTEHDQMVVAMVAERTQFRPEDRTMMLGEHHPSGTDCGVTLRLPATLAGALMRTSPQLVQVIPMDGALPSYTAVVRGGALYWTIEPARACPVVSTRFRVVYGWHVLRMADLMAQTLSRRNR